MASSLVFGSGAVDPANASTYTFSGMSFGTAASDRYVVAVLSWRAAGTSATVSSVTIGGVSATLVGSARNNTGGNTSQSDMYIAAVPSGSTGSVVLNLSGGAVRCGCATYALYGINPTPIDVETVTPSGSAPQQIDATLSLASASHVIGGVFAGTDGARSWINTASDDLSAGSPTVSMFSGLSWSGLTQRYIAEIEATNGAFNAGVFAAWAQDAGGGPDPVTGTGAASAPALSLGATVAAAGALAIAAVTGVGAGEAPALTLAASAEASGAFSVEAVSGSGAASAPALTLGNPTASGAGEFTGLAFTGTASATAPALSLGAPVASVSAAYVVAGATGEAQAVAPALVLSAPVAASEGAFVIEGATGAASAVAPALTLSAAAEGAAVHIGPVAGSGVAVAPALTLAADASASGEYSIGGATGAGAAIAPALSLGASATGAGLYTDFEIFPPTLTFLVSAEPSIFTVTAEATRFVVAREQTIFTVIREAA